MPVDRNMRHNASGNNRERHGLAILINLTEDTVLHAAHCDVLAVRLKASGT